MRKNKPNPALVVEDDALTALATQDLLVSEGYDPVEICDSAKAALALLADLAPRLLVLDAGLADRADGWLIAELARETISPAPRLIFLTGSPDQIPAHIAQLGTVLAKPCGEDALREAVRAGR